MFTHASADLQHDVHRAVAEMQKIALSLHQRTDCAPSAYPHDSRFLVEAAAVPGLITVFPGKIDHLRPVHEVHQDVRRCQMILIDQLEYVAGKTQKFRDIVILSHCQVLPVIVLWIDPFPVILADRIRRKDRAVRLNVGEHHAQIAHCMFKIGLITCTSSQCDHGIIVDAVIISRGFFCVLAVIIAVDPFRQILSGRFRKLWLMEESRTFHQVGSDRPAVVRRVEAALQQAKRSLLRDAVKFLVDLFLTGITFCPLQIVEDREHAFDDERGVRCGVKIALDQIKQPIFVLAARDKVQSEQNALCHPAVVMVPALLIAVSGCHARDAVDRVFRVQKIVPVGKCTAVRARRIRILDPQGFLHPCIRILQDSFIMLSHRPYPFPVP